MEDLARHAARAQVQFRLALAAFAVEEHHDALGSEAVNSLALALGLSPRQVSDRLGDALGLHSHPRLAVASGPAHQVEAMLTVLDTMTFPPAPDDTRLAAQRRFDCLYAVLTGQATPSQWQVHVLTQMETLLGENEHPAETAGGQLLPAQVARDLAAQGTLRRVLVDDHGRLVAVEASTDRSSPISTPPAPTPASRGETDPEVDAAVLEPDPDVPSEDDRAWFEQQQWTARVRDPLPVPAVTDVDAKPVATGDEELLEVGAEEPLDEPVDPPSPDAIPDAAAEPAQAPAVPSTLEDSLAQRLERLLARPFTPADLTSPGYRPNRALRRRLAVRDRTCRFPGCPNRICDLDHVTAWPTGPTSDANLVRECQHHHQAKHQHVTVQLLPDGTLRWTDRGGRHHDNPVPVLLTAQFHHHQRPDRRLGTDPPAEDGSQDP